MTASDEADDIDDMTLLEPFSCSIAWCTLILSVLGVLTNAVSIYIYTHRLMRSPVNVLLAGLSGIDLCLSAFCIPSFVVPGWSLCYDTDTIQTVMSYSTVYVYPFTMMAQSASVWTFLVIAFDRWIAVCHPLKARWCTIERSYRALIAVSVAAVSYNIVRFFEFSLKWDETEPDQPPIVELLLKNHTLYPIYMPVYYVGMYLLTHFIVPFTVLISLNVLMILSIIKARRQRLMLGRKQKSEHKTTIMMGVVVFVFVLCNTVPFILNFIEAVDPKFFRSNKTMLLGWILLDTSNLLVVVNTSTTAFIYYACSQKYRKLFIHTLNRLCCGFRYVPFRCCAQLQSEISAMNGGYSMTTSTSYHTTATVTTSGVGLATSLCAVTVGQFLPDKYKNKYGRSMSDCRSPKLSDNRKATALNRRGTTFETGSKQEAEDVNLV